MTPEQLLDETDRLLQQSRTTTRGLWPRACAWLLRLALESALDAMWARVRPEIASAPRRAQLLVLPEVTGRELAVEVAQTWGALSRAGHHHTYELAPTAAELRGWEEAVRGHVAELRGMRATGSRSD
jgi:hypothetical protein